MTQENNKKPHILIKGITQQGEIFRPSDWAERICGKLSTFRGRRIYYSSLLKPVLKGGYRCILVAPELEQSHPKLYANILNFAHNNKLQLAEETSPTSQN